MALSKSIAVNKKTMKLRGFVDLGKHAPQNQKYERGDHALVFMYQPFRGRWNQVKIGFLMCNHFRIK